MKTFDLTTLGLSDGTHSITVKAKGTNWKDSVESNAVSYEVASEDALAGTWVFNELPSLTDTELYYSNGFNIEFVSNGTTYTVLNALFAADQVVLKYGTTAVYEDYINETYTGWLNDSYKTIEVISTITGTTGIINTLRQRFLEFLLTYATKRDVVPYSSRINVIYNGVSTTRIDLALYEGQLWSTLDGVTLYAEDGYGYTVTINAVDEVMLNSTNLGAVSSDTINGIYTASYTSSGGSGN